MVCVHVHVESGGAWNEESTNVHIHEKNISGGARQAILRSLDSAVSSLLALISREYAQLV